MILHRVREQRLERGLTQAQLAELAHLERVAIVRLETSTRNPHMSTLQTIARALGINVADLFRE